MSNSLNCRNIKIVRILQCSQFHPSGWTVLVQNVFWTMCFYPWCCLNIFQKAMGQIHSESDDSLVMLQPFHCAASQNCFIQHISLSVNIFSIKTYTALSHLRDVSLGGFPSWSHRLYKFLLCDNDVHVGCTGSVTPVGAAVPSHFRCVCAWGWSEDIYPPPLSWVNFLWDMTSEFVTASSLFFSVFTDPQWSARGKNYKSVLKRCYWYFNGLSCGVTLL